MIRIPRIVLAVCTLASFVVLVTAVIGGDWWLALLAAFGTFGAGIGALQQ